MESAQMMKLQKLSRLYEFEAADRVVRTSNAQRTDDLVLLER